MRVPELADALVRLLRRMEEIQLLSIAEIQFQLAELIVIPGSHRTVEHLALHAEIHREVPTARNERRDLSRARARRRTLEDVVAVRDRRLEVGLVADGILRGLPGDLRRAVRPIVGVRRFLGVRRRTFVVCADDIRIRAERQSHILAQIRRDAVVALVLELLGIDVRRPVVGAHDLGQIVQRKLARRDLARARHRDGASHGAIRRLRTHAVLEAIVCRCSRSRRRIRTRKLDLVLDVLAILDDIARRRARDVLVAGLQTACLLLVDGRRRLDLRAVAFDELVLVRRAIGIAEVRAEQLVVRRAIRAVRDSRRLVIHLVDARLLQEVDRDVARRDATRTRNGIVIRRVERTRRAAAAAIVEFIVCERLTIRRVARLEDIGKNLRTIGIRGRVVDIFRRRRARGAVLVVGLVVRSTDGELELVLIRLDDVLPRV